MRTILRDKSGNLSIIFACTIEQNSSICKMIPKFHAGLSKFYQRYSIGKCCLLTDISSSGNFAMDIDCLWFMKFCAYNAYIKIGFVGYVNWWFSFLEYSSRVICRMEVF